MKNKLICVTNRHLCEDDFLDRLRGIACAGNELNNSDNKRQTEFWGIMLREKDLSFPEYEKLAREVKKICDNAGVVFIAHFFTGIGFTDHLHLPLHKLKKYRKHQGCTDKHTYLGASCHSVEDAQLAESLGCSYITFGHVFETDCKKGLAPKGLSLLNDVVRSVSIPVYAIGGISPENYHQIIQSGAAGACIMSGFMQCKDPAVIFPVLHL
ncbi:MAG: thiamine phosphate synthase [Anaerovoracaceae bacterium]|nr:thiamine phosphate synthase [Anaerovoracaceae bacterium]